MRSTRVTRRSCASAKVRTSLSSLLLSCSACCACCTALEEPLAPSRRICASTFVNSPSLSTRNAVSTRASTWHSIQARRAGLIEQVSVIAMVGDTKLIRLGDLDSGGGVITGGVITGGATTGCCTTCTGNEQLVVGTVSTATGTAVLAATGTAVGSITARCTSTLAGGELLTGDATRIFSRTGLLMVSLSSLSVCSIAWFHSDRVMTPSWFRSMASNTVLTLVGGVATGFIPPRLHEHLATRSAFDL
mmetsp:Transcript_18229/g.42453  ORF Transcript_18229/g.42453 Transcript_18229/m.42453 type:complete len:247 (+) Transcript_18229:1849-2589(+)